MLIRKNGACDAFEPQQKDRAQREVVLAALRTTCKWLELMRADVEMHGVALANGAIDPQTALRLTEEVAPGCLPPNIKALCIANGWEILS